MKKLSVEEILKAIDQLSEEEWIQIEHELEEHEWQKLYQAPVFIEMMQNRIIESKEARRSGNLKTAEQLRAEFEMEGLL
ncbi:MAG: hypothetical protein ACE5PV_08750 [Candidatus Poribacteria bacterium]